LRIAWRPTLGAAGVLAKDSVPVVDALHIGTNPVTLPGIRTATIATATIATATITTFAVARHWRWLRRSAFGARRFAAKDTISVVLALRIGALPVGRAATFAAHWCHWHGGRLLVNRRLLSHHWRRC
jgi:hypothetical protein